MKLRKRLRGPKLGVKLMLLGLALLIVPWFSYRQLAEMERLLIQGRSQTQLLTAEGISTLFNGREDLFNDLPVDIEDYESLFAHPLQGSARLDGRIADWGEGFEDELLTFGAENAEGDGSFQLLLGEQDAQLYVYLRVKDGNIVYRDPDYLRLDNADQVRLSFIRTDGDDGRISLVFSESGGVTAYQMDEDWRFAASGAPESAIPGRLELLDSGWALEFRLPLKLLGSRRHFGLMVADVDDPETREIMHRTQTLPKAGKESFNLVVLRSPEVLNIIQGLGYSGARILVIDAQQRVRAEIGALDGGAGRAPGADAGAWLRDGFAAIRPILHRFALFEAWQPGRSSPENSEAIADEIIGRSLGGAPLAQPRSIDGGLEIIMAAHPIVSRDQVIGTVVVEQNIDDILNFQRAALEQTMLLSVASLLAVLVALLAFAGRLAWRIGNLRREASAAIDQHGRLKTSALRNEVESGDEIGDLSRSVSGMLSKLHQYTAFLERMPRTLRHEINNPLNTLSTSLQNLAGEHPAVRDSKYLESARRGVLRIGAIVQNLADAANLEESLEAEERAPTDIQQFLESYVANCRLAHPRCEFLYRSSGAPACASISDHHIEQMLDKIIDNAIDFRRGDSPIVVQLDAYQGFLQISVANRGPALPERLEKSLFDSMVSHRGAQNRLHFGLGLHVARVIAEHHGGHVRALNLRDGSGVALMVQLPIAPGMPPAAGRRSQLRPPLAAQASR